jgi:gliding motility-associated-like protein
MFNLKNIWNISQLKKRNGLIICLLFAAFLPTFSQTDYSTRNNYTGDWETPTSWEPVWDTPQTDNIDFNITINGSISCRMPLAVSGNTNILTVNDTLIICGDLELANKSSLVINPNGILIVCGNLATNNKATITLNSNAYLVVTGDYTKQGTVKDGSFISNNTPSNVFIGGTVPEGLVPALFPVFSCPGSSPYNSSQCSYGNMIDLVYEPIYPFFQAIHSPSAPIITASGPLTFCDGDSVTMTSSAGATYLWSTGATTESINVSTSGSFTVNITTSNRCATSTSAPVGITIIDLPAALITVFDNSGNVNNDAIICEGDTVTLIASGGESYNWSTGETTALIVTDIAGTYSVTVSDFNGCSASKDTSIIVNITPTAVISITDNSGNINNDGIICEGENAILFATGGESYSWSTGDTTAEITTIAEGDYNVTITDNNGCQASKDTSISVHVTPTALISVTDNSGIANNDGIICEGENAILIASGGESYSWSTGDTTAEITTGTAGIYSVTVSNTFGCLKSVNRTITINLLPEVDAGTGGDVCGDNFTLNASSDIGSGTWSITSAEGNVTFSPDVYDPTATIGIAVYGNYQLTWTAVSENCPASAAVYITFHEIPVANAGDDQLLNSSTSTSMEADLSTSETGEWSLLSGSGIIDDNNSPVTPINDLTQGENIFLWTVSSAYCSDSDSVVIIVDINIPFVPQVITPNGDGKNDFLIIDGIENFSPAELVIINRWGSEVYNNHDYLNTWDGKNNKNDELLNDTYYYTLKLSNGDIYNGFVVIKK